MKKNKKDNKVIKYPKSYSFSIGIVIIGVMFIYMLYHMFTYITAENITVYEVSQGSISSNLEYNALAIREETVYTAQSSGNILYLAENFGRVGVKTKIYAVDEKGTIAKNISKADFNDIKIDDRDKKSLESSIYTYITSYENLDYGRVYSFKTELQSQIEQLYNITAINSMEADVTTAINNGSFHIFNADKPGLVVYSIDGMEDLTLENYTIESFDTSKVSATNLKSQQSIVPDQPIYKIVTSDNWNLVCEIDKSLYESLQEQSYIEIKFLEDDTKTWTKLSLEEKDGKYFLILSLDDSMERYAASRFIHIKLLDKDISGLKIPNSSIVNKNFFTIPKAYFYQGDNSSDLGLMIKDSSGSNRFVSPTIYYATDDYYYIDNESVENGDILIKSNSSDKYIVGTNTAHIQGVHNVNKGYAVFKQIEIIYQNADYSIIKTGTDYGISMYDHIVLQGDAVEENTIIN